jgi:hypothetical protein
LTTSFTRGRGRAFAPLIPVPVPLLRVWVVPVLALGPRIRPVPLGRRRTFADMGQTIAEYLGVPALPAGTSFLREVLHG